MKLNTSGLFPSIFVFLCCFPLGAFSQLQVNKPSTWDSFVKSSSNKIVRDTFRMQTFDPISLPEELAYTVSGRTELFNPAEEGITDGSDATALRMLPGSIFRLELPEHGKYTKIYLQAIFAAWKVDPSYQLYVTAEREKDPITRRIYLTPPTADYCRSFKQNKENSLGKLANILIYDNAVNLELEVVEVQEECGGFYAIDSAYASGHIPTYSLFRGNGSWRDSDRWSHEPALRHRRALINGNVLVEFDTQCKEIYLGNGSLTIGRDQKVETDKLLFSGEDASLSSMGELLIKDQITVCRTFSETGKWYFLSFPFDVYMDGIDPDFTHGDEQINSGGNYFYVCSYNGSKRAANGTQEANWKIINASVSPDQPIFEAGKGYLFALDALADKQTLSFSFSGSLPEDFARSGKLTVSFSGSVKEEEEGWGLYGNPFPSPLPVSSLFSDALDGYVYVFQNGVYKAYSFSEDYAISPFSAFFLKANRESEIYFSNTPLSHFHKMISNSGPLLSTKAEPRAAGSTSSPASILPIQTPDSYLKMNVLFIENLSVPGMVYIYDPTGRLHWKKAVDSGMSVVHLPSSLPSGNYIVHIDAGSYQCQHWLVWNQSVMK